MLKRSEIKWVPLDSNPSKPTDPRFSWNPLSVDDDANHQKLLESPSEEISGFLKNMPIETPDTFRDDASHAYNFISKLDQDPDAAIQDPRIRKFVSEIARSGFCGSVYVRYRLKILYKNAADPSVALPIWLQDDFLRKYDVVDLQESTSSEEGELIEKYFDHLVQKKSFKDTPNGRYFTLSSEASLCPRPRMFKTYLEGAQLFTACQNGSLKKAFDALERLPFGLQCKLFESSRLVIYGLSDVRCYDEIERIFVEQKISLRGPAQDVWVMDARNQKMQLSVAYSNDQALGDGEGLLDTEYTATMYHKDDFFSSYLRLCAAMGKSPAEPYLTSFVCAVGTARTKAEKQNILAETELLTGYPAVLVKSRRELMG